MFSYKSSHIHTQEVELYYKNRFQKYSTSYDVADMTEDVFIDVDISRISAGWKEQHDLVRMLYCTEQLYSWYVL